MKKIVAVAFMLTAVIVASIVLVTYTNKPATEGTSSVYTENSSSSNASDFGTPESKAGPAPYNLSMLKSHREAILKKNGLLDTRRITLEEVKDIIATSADINGIITKIEEIHIAHDYIGGSGIARSEYWLDDKGTIKVEVYEVLPSTCIALEDLSDPNNRKFIALYGRGPFEYTED